MNEWISAMTRNPFSRIHSPRIFWQLWLHCWHGDIVLGKTLLLNLYFKKPAEIAHEAGSIIGSKSCNWVHIIQFCVGENGTQAPFFQLKIPTWPCSCSSYSVNWYAIGCEDVVSFFLFIQQILIKCLGGGGDPWTWQSTEESEFHWSMSWANKYQEKLGKGKILTNHSEHAKL